MKKNFDYISIVDIDDIYSMYGSRNMYSIVGEQDSSNDYFLFLPGYIFSELNKQYFKMLAEVATSINLILLQDSRSVILQSFYTFEKNMSKIQLKLSKGSNTLKEEGNYLSYMIRLLSECDRDYLVLLAQEKNIFADDKQADANLDLLSKKFKYRNFKLILENSQFKDADKLDIDKYTANIDSLISKKKYDKSKKAIIDLKIKLINKYFRSVSFPLVGINDLPIVSNKSLSVVKNSIKCDEVVVSAIICNYDSYWEVKI